MSTHDATAIPPPTSEHAHEGSSSPEASYNRLGVTATLHCMTGCVIGPGGVVLLGGVSPRVKRERSQQHRLPAARMPVMICGSGVLTAGSHSPSGSTRSCGTNQGWRVWAL